MAPVTTKVRPVWSGMSAAVHDVTAHEASAQSAAISAAVGDGRRSPRSRPGAAGAPAPTAASAAPAGRPAARRCPAAATASSVPRRSQSARRPVVVGVERAGRVRRPPRHVGSDSTSGAAPPRGEHRRDCPPTGVAEHQRPAGAEHPGHAVGQHARASRSGCGGQAVEQLQLAVRVDLAGVGRIDSTCTPSTVAAAVTRESASLSGGSSTTRSSMALPGQRSMTSTLRMSAPTVPSADRHRAERAGAVGQHEPQQVGHGGQRAAPMCRARLRGHAVRPRTRTACGDRRRP